MWVLGMMLVGQAGGAEATWVAAVAQLGLSVVLVLWFVIYAGPRERREWQEALRAALAEQRKDHERWQQQKDDLYAKLIGVITDARFEVLREVKEGTVGTNRMVDELSERVNKGFDDALRAIADLRAGRRNP